MRMKLFTLRYSPTLAGAGRRGDSLIELAKEQGSNAVLATLPIGSGAPLLDDIREVIARMQDEEAAGLDASQAKADASLRRATWLGGAMAKNMAATAKFLVEQKKIPTALDDYSKFVNVSYLQDAMK